MVNPMKEQMLTQLRQCAMIRNKHLLNDVVDHCQGLTTEQVLFIQNALNQAAVFAIRDVMMLTPQQFNAVRSK